MSKNKKIFLIAFALFIVVLNIVLYVWVQSLRTEEVTYLKNVDVSKLAFDNQGRVWAFIVTRTPDGTGMSELREYENSIPIHIYTNKDTPALENINIQDFIFDNMGRVWFTLDDDNSGVARLLVVFDGKEWHASHPSFMNSKNWITALAVDAKGRAWIGIFNQGLYILDEKGLENYTVGNSDLINNTITDIAFDNQDRAWITSYDYHETGGVNIFDGKDWQTFTPITSSLLTTHVNTIIFDRQNRAWIGTERGISVFDGTNWISYPANAKDLNRGVDGLAIDGQGRAWVSQTTFAPRTLVFDGKTWGYYFDPFNQDVWNTIVDRDGNIWSAFDNGAVIIRPNSSQPVSFTAVVLSLAVVSGLFVYLTILLLIMWASVAFAVWRHIGIGLVGFPIYVIWINMMASGNNFDLYSKYIHVSSYFLLNPGVFGTIGGIFGGFLGIFFKRSGHTGTEKWGVIGFVVGTVLSICSFSLLGLMSQ